MKLRKIAVMMLVALVTIESQGCQHHAGKL